MMDFATRRDDIEQEISSEKGDSVLRCDWTKKVGKQCGADYMFNAMSGDNKILASTLTKSVKPFEIEYLLHDLCRRGVCPQVIYVDEECCGAWLQLGSRVWPGCAIRLDAMHAIRRLTETTAGTQHIWHGEFCRRISDAMFKRDPILLKRLREAWAQHGPAGNVPKNILMQYVPRIIRDGPKIAEEISRVIQDFNSRMHSEQGALINSGTLDAWAKLQPHVTKGCVCDPDGIDMYCCDESKPLQLGEHTFYRLRVLRGTSPLENFHCHQKQWLGQFGMHSQDAGMAQIQDGTVRWNRRRAKKSEGAGDVTPDVYAGGLLRNIRELSEHLLDRNS